MRREGASCAADQDAGSLKPGCCYLCACYCWKRLCFFTDAGIVGLHTGAFLLVDQSSTHFLALSAFTVDDLWRKLSFLSSFHVADDGSDTGAHTVRAVYSIWCD